MSSSPPAPAAAIAIALGLPDSHFSPSDFSRLERLFSHFCAENFSLGRPAALEPSQVLALLQAFGELNITEFEVADFLTAAQRDSSFSSPLCDFPLFCSLFTQNFSRRRTAAEAGEEEKNFPQNKILDKLENDELDELYDQIIGNSQGTEEELTFSHLKGFFPPSLAEEIFQEISKDGKKISREYFKQLLIGS